MSARTGFQLRWSMTVTAHSVSGLWRHPLALPVPAQAPWSLPHPCPWPTTSFQPSLGPSVLSPAHPERPPGLLWLTLDLAHASGQPVSSPTMFCTDEESEKADFATHLYHLRHSHFPAVSYKWEPALKLRSASDWLNHSAWCKGQVRGEILRLDEDCDSLAPYHQKVHNLSV